MHVFGGEFWKAWLCGRCGGCCFGFLLPPLKTPSFPSLACGSVWEGHGLGSHLLPDSWNGLVEAGLVCQLQLLARSVTDWSPEGPAGGTLPQLLALTLAVHLQSPFILSAVLRWSRLHHFCFLHSPRVCIHVFSISVECKC